MLTILRWSLVYSQSFNSTISKHTCYDAASTMIVASSSVIAVVPLRRWPEDIDCGLLAALLAIASILLITRNCCIPSSSSCNPASKLMRSSWQWRQRWVAAKLPSVTFTNAYNLRQTFCTHTQRDRYNAQATVITTRKARWPHGGSTIAPIGWTDHTTAARL